MIKNIGVHQSHCCVIHGCKYGFLDCPVSNGEIVQKFPCESCHNERIKYMAELTSIQELDLKKCPHCGSYY